MSPRRHRAFAVVALAFMVGACSPVERPKPTRSPPASEPPRVAEKMIVEVHLPMEQALGAAFGSTPSDLPLFSLHPNGSLWDDVVRRFVYSGVYRYDETQTPVLDLAEAPCTVSGNLVLITCVLREAAFHDGTPLTADDVAFTYQMLRSEACRLPSCLGPEPSLAAATALDDRTVEFRLSAPDPAFITDALPQVLVEPRTRVERAFAEFVKASDGADPAQLEAVASRLESTIHPQETECTAPDEAALVEAEGAIAGIGREIRKRDVFAISPDDCAYGDYLVRVLTDAADALGLTGIDAIAAAYRILEPPPIPVGSGPWRVLSIDPGVSMQLDAFDAFYRGKPATQRLEVRLIHSTADAIQAVRSGAIHWLLQPFPSGGSPIIAEGIDDAPGVAWEEYSRLLFYGLHYNLREGRLFADPNLREAMELCVDKDETVAAATGGEGVPIYSPISPSMWAYQPDLPRPTRNIEEGKRRIEASGWTLGDDGIYRMGDRRLTTMIPVRENPGPEHLRFLELLAFQVADCGIEIVAEPVSLEDLDVALTWPLVSPGADQPWDAVFAGWLTTLDPDFSELYHSRAIATASNPEGGNYMSYASRESDSLLEQGRATYDPRKRARLYRDLQAILARDRPVLFAWSPRLREPRSDRLESTRGPLATSTSTWWWQLETLFLRSPDP